MKERIHVGGRLNIEPKEIVMFRGDVNYTHIHTKSEGVLTVATTLKVLETRLTNAFYRSHKSFIVNIAEINGMTETGLTLSNHSKVLISRRRKKGLMKKLRRTDWKRILNDNLHLK